MDDPPAAAARGAGMKVTVREPSASRRSLEVEVPAEEVRREVDRTARDYARGLQVPGFRRGHVPLALVLQRHGKEIEAEVVERLARDASRRIIEEKDLRPLNPPVIEQVRYRDGQPLTFRTTFEVRPRFALGPYRGLEAVRRRAPVTDELVEGNLEALRQQNARFDAVEGRPLQMDDLALVDLQPVDGKGAPRGKARQAVALYLGEGGAPEDLRRQLLGLEPGSTREVTVAHAIPEAEAGAAAGPPGPTAAPAPPPPDRYRVTLRSIRRRVLPALDDDLARDVGPFLSLADLRKRLREDLEARAAERADGQVREALLRQLVDAHPFAPPQVLVDAELGRMMEQLLASLVQAGADPRRVGVDWEKKRAELRPVAESRVRADLVLDEIGRAEGLEVSDEEILGALQEQSKRERTTPAALKATLEQDGRLNLLRIKMLREKSLDLVVRSANIIG
jgi:trigger factor